MNQLNSMIITIQVRICRCSFKKTDYGERIVVAITNGQLDFGPWEQIFYGEFDG